VVSSFLFSQHLMTEHFLPKSPMPSLLPRTFSRSSFALGALAMGIFAIALPARAQNTPAPATTAQSQTAWTTYKGNYQRTGNSGASITLPLSQQWRFSSDGPARGYINSPLVVGAPGRQRIIFAAGKAVYALDSQTGQQVWKSADLPADVGTPLTLLQSDAGDFILAAQDNGRVAALDTSRGNLAWNVDTKSRIADAGPIVITTANGPRVLVAVSNGQVIAIDSAGAIDPNWKLTLDRFGASPASSMALSPDGAQLFILVADGRLFVVDLETPKVRYTIRLNGRSLAAPVVTKDGVVTVVGTTVLSSSLDNGRKNWGYTAKGDVVGSPGVGNDNTIFCGTRNGFFQALNSETGEVKWQKNIKEANFSGSPIVIGDTVLVGTSTGLMVGFNAQTGDIVWENLLQTTRTGSQGQQGRGRFGGFGGFGGQNTQQVRAYPISSSPAVVNGQIFVFADNGSMYALTSSPIDADPPRVTSPTLSVPGSNNDTATLALQSQSPPLIPGTGTVTLKAKLEDIGSGLNPASLSVSVNDTPLAADRVKFTEADASLELSLLDPKKGDALLEDGLKNVTIKVRDYAGNEMTYQLSFMVDKSAPAPNSRRFGMLPGGFGGFGGFGNPDGAPDGMPDGDPGGFPGGDPGGFPGGDPGGGFPGGFPGGAPEQ
jgi:outer membrane protein assembly factor BamB